MSLSRFRRFATTSSSPDQCGPAIDVAHLGVTLGGVPVLRDITFAMTSGETAAVLGGNGSGKTTLVRALLGLIPHTGSIALLGQDSRRFTQWRRLGYVPQRASVSLHAVTVHEVVASGTLSYRRFGPLRAVDKRRVFEAIAAVGLTDKTDEPFVHLSGGQQQRALIARGIVHDPDLLIMDEPFAGVDLTHQAGIVEAIASQREDRTILVVLHETEAMASLLDRVLVLREGRLIHDGPPPGGLGREATSPDGDHAGIDAQRRALWSGAHEHEEPARPLGIAEGWEQTWTS